ncbi:hypothetical protein V6N13_051152 [Hibiscus sabdariffa]
MDGKRKTSHKSGVVDANDETIYQSPRATLDGLPNFHLTFVSDKSKSGPFGSPSVVVKNPSLVLKTLTALDSPMTVFSSDASTDLSTSYFPCIL